MNSKGDVMKRKVLAHEIASTGYGIRYKCPTCGAHFVSTIPDVKFCSSCGQELDWGIIIKCNAEYKDVYFSSDNETKEKLLKELNKLNSQIEQDKQYTMELTEKTKLEILKTNMQYYLDMGYTKDDLINRKYFTKEEIEKCIE